ncbi:glycosyltransferase family 2 protein [Bilifractor sp. LCP21S3_A7]|uniref:glycosyltransferase family 2 protein n=1 Tax=Bilifractor sp. LCP21S3_A7 TaxID=3438738 RepID=UPI003F8F6EAD
MNYTVVIPVYNGEKTITRAIDSVIKQTRYDLIKQIIIVNDGSCDKSEFIVLKLQQTNDKILLINQKNSGPAAARNVGIRAAKTDFIALLDCDDEWDTNKIEIQDCILENNVNIRALGSNRVGEEIKIGKKYSKKIYMMTASLYCFKNWPCTPSLVFDKTIFHDNSWFPENIHFAEEGLFFISLAQKTGLYYTSLPLVKCGGGKRAFGVSGLSGNLRRMHEGNLEMIKNAYKLNYINATTFVFSSIFECVKYIRRIIVKMVDKR